jgi:hypothetical protein
VLLLILAATDITTALITAGATLLGVMVGAVLGGLIDYRLARRREQAEGRAGARLLQVNLSEAGPLLAAAERDSTWLATAVLRTDAWNQYRGVMASVLDASRWETVAKAMGALQELEADIQQATVGAEGYFGSVDLPRRMAVKAGQARRDARQAYNALADLAGTERKRELAPPRVAPDPGDQAMGS